MVAWKYVRTVPLLIGVGFVSSTQPQDVTLRFLMIVLELIVLRFDRGRYSCRGAG